MADESAAVKDELRNDLREYSELNTPHLPFSNGMDSGFHSMQRMRMPFKYLLSRTECEFGVKWTQKSTLHFFCNYQ